MPRGHFITFEGLDGSGKTTQIRRLAAWLEQHGHPTIVTRQPGATATGNRIREILLDARNVHLAPSTEMALMFADRAQAIEEVIQPGLDAGKVVLCDRFTDSSEAYQGGGRELGSETILALHRLVCGNLQPDLTILLLPGFEASLARARRRNSRDEVKTGKNEGRFEAEQDVFSAACGRSIARLPSANRSGWCGLRGISIKPCTARLWSLSPSGCSQLIRGRRPNTPMAYRDSISLFLLASSLGECSRWMHRIMRSSAFAAMKTSLSIC